MKIIFIFSCSGMFRNVPACSGMLRHVPECSGMFHVPGLIDALYTYARATRMPPQVGVLSHRVLDA